MTGRAICFQLGPNFPTCEGCGLRGLWVGGRGFAGLVLGGLARLEGGGGGAPGRVSGSPGLFFPPLSQAEMGPFSPSSLQGCGLWTCLVR